MQLPEKFTATLTRRDGTSVLMDWVVFATDASTGTPRNTPEAFPRWVALTELDRLTLQKNVAAAVRQAQRALAG